jgi:hypothetical protein
MDALSQLGDQVRMFLDQHVPPVAMVTSAITAVVIGLGLSVLGAKLARFAMTAVFALGGAAVGALISREWAVSVPLSMLVSGGFAGVIGFFFHRLWIGLITALLFAGIIGGGVGLRSLAPMLADYEQMPAIVQTTGNGGFTIPDPETQADYLNPEFRRWAQGFWSYAKGQDLRIQEKLSLLTVGAALVGFLLGALAVRFTLILVTAILGTAMVTSGLAALAQQYQPDLVQASIDHPQIGALACGIFLVGSLVVQTLLTSSDKSSRTATAKVKPR